MKAWGKVVRNRTATYEFLRPNSKGHSRSCHLKQFNKTWTSKVIMYRTDATNFTFVKQLIALDPNLAM